ncbi:MAG: L-threonylcarbamoyladenylate synthase [Candidatus Kariarchaeaceae archaeon]
MAEKVPIVEVAEDLVNGSIMLYPTDTLPGIGCLGSSSEAIAKLFAIKKRAQSKPVSYAFSSFDMMSRYVEISAYTMKFQPLLPGKLTMVLPKKKNAPKLYGVESQSLGCRIPQVGWLLELISYLDAPIVTTSANISGTQPVNKVNDIPREILDQLDLIIEWSDDLLGTGSTIIDLSEKHKFKILREGAISKERIESLILD